MNDWKLAQRDHSEQLAKLHFFSFTKKHAAGELEARITVKEFASAQTSDMQFFAQADIELNQKAMNFRPCRLARNALWRPRRLPAQPA
jgi:hypothetical protein